MANKNTITRTETTYEFEISHEDIVGMMNDPQVLVEGGNVLDDQEFTLFLKKSNGGEILLKDMNENDTLVIRYTKVVVADDPETLGEIDIEAP